MTATTIIKKKTNEHGAYILYAAGDLTVREVTEFAKVLRQHLSQCDKASLNLSRVVRFDCAGAQLLISALKTPLKSGNMLEITNMSPVVETYLSALGFLNNRVLEPAGEGA